jgi:hypothetical protein
MSKAVIHGDTVYLAGIVADDPKGKSVAEQTSNILSQIDGFLAMAGTNKTKLLSANIWITDMAHFSEMNSVWDGWVSPGNTPARATCGAPTPTLSIPHALCRFSSAFGPSNNPLPDRPPSSRHHAIGGLAYGAGPHPTWPA